MKARLLSVAVLALAVDDARLDLRLYTATLEKPFAVEDAESAPRVVLAVHGHADLVDHVDLLSKRRLALRAALAKRYETVVHTENPR